jgi:hypothetical protein
MKYALLIYQPHPFDPKSLSPEEYKQVAADYAAVTATQGATSGPPIGLPAHAITVQVRDGQIVKTDGPYVSVAGAVGGFVIYEAESDADAVELAARIPAARQGGAVEVRRCEVYW